MVHDRSSSLFIFIAFLCLSHVGLSCRLAGGIAPWRVADLGLGPVQETLGRSAECLEELQASSRVPWKLHMPSYAMRESKKSHGKSWKPLQFHRCKNGRALCCFHKNVSRFGGLEMLSLQNWRSSWAASPLTEKDPKNPTMSQHATHHRGRLVLCEHVCTVPADCVSGRSIWMPGCVLKCLHALGATSIYWHAVEVHFWNTPCIFSGSLIIVQFHPAFPQLISYDISTTLICFSTCSTMYAFFAEHTWGILACLQLLVVWQTVLAFCQWKGCALQADDVQTTFWMSILCHLHRLL